MQGLAPVSLPRPRSRLPVFHSHPSKICPAQERETGPALLRGSVCPTHPESRAGQRPYPATPLHFWGSVPATHCSQWRALLQPKLQLPFSFLPPPSSGGNPAQLCPRAFASPELSSKMAVGLSMSTSSPLSAAASEAPPLREAAGPHPTRAMWGREAGRGQRQDPHPSARASTWQPPTPRTAGR